MDKNELHSVIDSLTHPTEKQIKEVAVESCKDQNHTINWAEAAERIVIEYANLSGRESSNRSEFRKRVLEILKLYGQKIKKEERQFILNVLDGVDIADEQMGNNKRTKAIRFALQSRAIK